MRFKFLLFLIFLICFFTFLRAEPFIVLKDKEIKISKDKIYLCDVADFFGFSEDEKNKLENIYLKKASLPGYKTVISKEMIINKVAKLYNNVKVTGPDKVVLFVKKSEISKEELVKAAEDFIKKNMPWKEDEVKIDQKNVKEVVNIPEGEVLLKVREDKDIKFKGNVIIPVEIYIDNKFYKIEPVSFVINVVTDCLIAKKNIKIKEFLKEEDYIIAKKDITFLPDDVILSNDELNGLITKRAIIAGTVLQKSMFETPPLFKRGTNVGVIVQVKKVTVETEGIAMTDGREGDLVKVKLNNGKILEGKVNYQGKVIIEK
jgi:flagella basal body P-ring formation protein FlgA